MYFAEQNKMQKRDTMEMNFEVHETQKRNKPADRSLRVDGKMGSIF